MGTGQIRGVLTDVKVRQAKATAAPYKLVDGDGLFLFVTPAGLKSWRLRYKIAGRDNLFVLGRYPDLTLAAARLARDAAKQSIRQSGTPRVEAVPAPAPPLVPTFEEAARQWHALNKSRWKPHHAADVLNGLEVEVIPAFGALPIDQVTGGIVLDALRAMEVRGAVETGRRIKQRCSQIFLFAISHGWCAADPTAGLRAALAPLPPKGRRPAIVTLKEAVEMIAVLDAAPGQPTVKLAMRFLGLIAARPGEVAGMLWTELAGTPEAPEWHIPPARTKITQMRAKSAEPHIVPLAPAAVDCLEAVRELSGESRFVFPGVHSLHRPLSENALGYTLVRLGFQNRHVPHGWRSTFSTIMNELFPADRHIIDLMLAHKPADVVEAAYNRSLHMQRRRELAEIWAGLLLKGAIPAAQIVAGPRRAVT